MPGGRIRKGELFDDAMQRLLSSELGREAAERLQPVWQGLYEQHYPDSMAAPDVATHYMVLAHQLIWPAGRSQSLPTEQHDAYRWQPVDEVAAASDVYVHTR